MWYKQLVYYCFLLLLPLMLCVGCVSQSDYEALQKENESLKIEVNQLTEDFNLEQESNLSLDDYNIRLQKELNLYKATFGEVYENIKPPYRSAKSINLTNNPDATNPTWAELVAFLEKDETEKIRYHDLELGALYTLKRFDKELGLPAGTRLEYFMCGDFANLLHDNAESNGIRAAVVVIHVTDAEYPHIFNAFVTTDRGLVYIDDTGTEDCKGVDKVEYIKMGNDIGAIDLWDGIGFAIKADNNINFPLDYEWFLQQKTLLDEYNQEVEKFNTEIKDKVYTLGTFEDRRIKAWEERLIELEKQLLPVFGREGIVTDVEIYW